MRKIKGRVVETLVIYKDVEVEVADDLNEESVQDAIRDEAFKKIITDPESGWELDETLEVDVQVEKS